MKIKNLLLGLILIIAAEKLVAAENEAQPDPYAGHHDDICVSVRLEDACFQIYDPPFKAKGIYEKIEEAKCRTPEELVESIQSETTQEWVGYNQMFGKSHVVSAKAFETRRNRDKNTNYFELIHKLSFLYNGIPTAIIKYYFVDEGKRTILASMIVQKKDGRWFRTSIAGLEHLEAVVNRLKSQNLAILLAPMPPEDASEFMRNLRKDVKGEQGVLNTEKLFEAMMKLKDKGSVDDLMRLIDKSNP